MKNKLSKKEIIAALEPVVYLVYKTVEESAPSRKLQKLVREHLKQLAAELKDMQKEAQELREKTLRKELKKNEKSQRKLNKLKKKPLSKSRKAKEVPVAI